MKIIKSTPHHFEEINPASLKLTAERLKAFPGCEGYTDEQAETIITSLEILSAICYESTKGIKHINIDNQLVVSLIKQKLAA